MSEPRCPGCGWVIPIVHSNTNPQQRWARHTQTGSLTSGDSPECVNSGMLFRPRRIRTNIGLILLLVILALVFTYGIIWATLYFAGWVQS